MSPDANSRIQTQDGLQNFFLLVDTFPNSSFFEHDSEDDWLITDGNRGLSTWWLRIRVPSASPLKDQGSGPTAKTRFLRGTHQGHNETAEKVFRTHQSTRPRVR